MSPRRTGPTLSAWQAQLLRLTAFPGPSVELTDNEWWSEVVGEPPDSKTFQPKEKSWQEEGIVGESRLILNVQPTTRIDWVSTVQEDQSLEVGTLSTLGALPDAVNSFSEMIQRWFSLDSCPTVIRLAFGAVLVQAVESRQEGYHLLSQHYLPFNIDNEGASDFLYQINRPRESKSLPRLGINRLSKWSVGVMRQLRFTMPPSLESDVWSHYHCRLELDINTVPNPEVELAKEQLPGIFEELVTFGLEIAAEGEIP